MRRRFYSGAGLMMGLLLAGCSGSVQEAPNRETKPVQETYTVKVPGMT